MIRRVFVSSLASLFALAVSALSGAEASSAPPPDGAPVTIPRARQYDITSKINGRDYRVFVAMPFKADPAKKYPVIYLLDGNWYFGPTAYNVTESGGARAIQQAIVVGIGYPSDDNDLAGSRRGFELTPTADANSTDPRPRGGGDAFLQVLEEEVKPLVAARYPVDPAHQILYGKSLGGLMVLRSLFRNPGAYQTYIAASPAISWNNRAVLNDEAAFIKRVQEEKLSLRLLITVGGDEVYHGDDPAQRAAAERNGMIPTAAGLAQRLSVLNSERVTISYAVIPDENHVMVSLASIGRALGFALKPK
ncbi:MAG TPA: alpha/beta hydrolase-fold protein [Lacunisphaera sp.]|nr:alpha/beta hydrolase-fold protein [Lacunisphaera sp.]